jgi:hypothetical protein
MMLAASDPDPQAAGAAEAGRAAARASQARSMPAPAPETNRTPLYVLGSAVAVGAVVLFLRRKHA